MRIMVRLAGLAILMGWSLGVMAEEPSANVTPTLARDGDRVVDGGYAFHRFGDGPGTIYRVLTFVIGRDALQVWLPTTPGTVYLSDYVLDERNGLEIGSPEPGAVVALTPDRLEAMKGEALDGLVPHMRGGDLMFEQFGSAGYLFAKNPGPGKSYQRLPIPPDFNDEISGIATAARGQTRSGETLPSFESTAMLQHELYSKGIVTDSGFAGRVMALRDEVIGLDLSVNGVDCWLGTGFTILGGVATYIGCGTAWTNPLSAAGCIFGMASTVGSGTLTTVCFWDDDPHGDPGGGDNNDGECTDGSGCCPSGTHECCGNQCCDDSDPPVNCS